jgi:exodeoxyribonuclease VIII
MDTIPCPEPGVYRDMPADEYHALEAVGSTTLKTIMARSPAHCLVQREPTPDLVIGDSCHACLLEPERFARSYAIMPGPEVDLRSNGTPEKPGRLAWLAFQAANPGKTCLRPTEGEQVLGMRQSVWAHKRAAALLAAAGEVELTIIWRDESTGLMCKCRPDAVCAQYGAYADLKTTRDAKPENFRRQAFTLGYHLQLAYYLEGIRRFMPHIDVPVVLVVEKTAPFPVVVYDVTEGLMAAGAAAFRQALDIYADCKRSGSWPGYSSGIELLDLPRWAASHEGSLV